VAGYTARDEAAARAHIAELAAIGIPPPTTVPAFYDLDPALLTTEPVTAASGELTSGEVEPVLVRAGGRYFLGVGSDHTDRELERTDIAASKAACPKPIGQTVAELADLDAVPWDELTAGSSVDGQAYQDGAVATLRHPAELLERMTGVLGDVTGDLVLFCGTMPLLTGDFVAGEHWRVWLAGPDGMTLQHAYQLKRRSR
jgi:4-hydroxyphenylacetate 3-monooxygenase